MKMVRDQIMADFGCAWYTADEMRFIERISSRKDKTALRGYIESIEKRAVWGKIEKRQVMAATRRLRKTVEFTHA